MPFPPVLAFGVFNCAGASGLNLCSSSPDIAASCPASCGSCIPFYTCPLPDDVEAEVKSKFDADTNILHLFWQSAAPLLGFQFDLICNDPTQGSISVDASNVGMVASSDFSITVGTSSFLIVSLSGKTEPTYRCINPSTHPPHIPLLSRLLPRCCARNLLARLCRTRPHGLY